MFVRPKCLVVIREDPTFVLERILLRLDPLHACTPVRPAAWGSDGCDPDVVPGIVDHPVPGGLSLSQMLEIVRAVRAASALEQSAKRLTPQRDIDGKIMQVGLRILEGLAE